MDGVDVLIAVLVTVAAFALWLVGTALLIWVERRVLAKMQSRIGPNRLGPFGVLQTLADGVKLFFKEDIAPTNVDRLTYYAAPLASAVVAILAFAVIPFGGSFQVDDRTVTLQVWDPEIGLLWILAMSSIGVYGIVLAGWSSGSKYPVIGGVRSSAQMISYELAMGLSLAAVFVYVGSLRVSDIVAAQQGALWGPIPAWHIVPQIVAFLIFFGAAVAETQRPPFDLPEAEGELVAGFHTEYSGAKFAMFFLAEFMQVITMSAVMVTAFLGGPGGPLLGLEGTIAGALLGVVWFVLKTAVLVFVFIWMRATLPRLRYDRLMDLGWRVMLPFGLIWVMLTAASVIWRQAVDQQTVFRVVAVGLVVALVLYIVAPLFSRTAGSGEANGGGGGGGTRPEDPDDDEGGGVARELPATDEAREEVGV